MSSASPSPTLAQIQASVDAWISQWDEGYFSPLSNLARLTEEVGELAREVNHSHGDKPKKACERTGSIGEELADILFVVATLANSLDIDLSEEFAKTMAKYDLRDAERWTKAT
ncbi:MAG: nucleotide pyrophosphohydrolase [Bradymonadaceae bacterium]|nr:nucleotide pyrophosphohydrolase [Lujinxingiaceae bacterium]